MPAFKRKRTLADEIAALDGPAPLDLDPEEDAPEVNSDSDASSEGEQDGQAAREHYEPVGKSKLRRPEIASLGPQYAGSRISRGSINSLDAGMDAQTDEDVVESASEEEVDVSDEDDVFSDEDGHTSNGTDMTDDEAVIDEERALPVRPAPQGLEVDRDELRRLLNDDRKSITASLTEAMKADANKGRAVKRQRQAFDALLNSRIKLQQGLIVTNTFPMLQESSTQDASLDFKSAETSLLNLWNKLHDFRQNIQSARVEMNSTKRAFEAKFDTSSAAMWTQMQNLESRSKSYREATLEKWSAKTQGATTRPASSKLNQSSKQTSITDVLNSQLLNMDRLIKRTQMARSCAPAQVAESITESDEIYDDADFYGVLLKELLEQRNVEAASYVETDTAAEQWKAAKGIKAKKNVDTRASKGRKIRYTLHEKLQNFMAPEDRRSWGQRQIDELFSSLLGRTMALGEANDDVMDEAMDGEQEALRLFRT